MYELGKKNEVIGSRLTDLKPITPTIYGKPTAMPFLWGKENEKVVCGFDQGLGEKMIVCDSLEDMQQLYDAYLEGYALNLNWYTAVVTPMVVVITLNNDPKIALNIINDIGRNLPLEVKEAIAQYACGNSGAATVLSKKAQSLHFKTAKHVERLVGWPQSESSEKRAAEIWERFKE